MVIETQHPASSAWKALILVTSTDILHTWSILSFVHHTSYDASDTSFLVVASVPCGTCTCQLLPLDLVWFCEPTIGIATLTAFSPCQSVTRLCSRCFAKSSVDFVGCASSSSPPSLQHHLYLPHSGSMTFMGEERGGWDPKAWKPDWQKRTKDQGSTNLQKQVSESNTKMLNDGESQLQCCIVLV